MYCCEHLFPTLSFIFFCFLTIVEHNLFTTFTRVQIFIYCLQYYICGKASVMVTKFIILKNILIKTFRLITFCDLTFCLSAASSERTLTNSFFKVSFWISNPSKGYLFIYLFILSFCLRTFQNLYCQGSVSYNNYFPYFLNYFHQRGFFFAGVVLIIDLKAGSFPACVKLLSKLFQLWSIDLDPFLNECLVPPDGLLILEGRKCLEHTTVDLVTLKPSLPSCHFIKLHQSFISIFSLGKWEKVIPSTYLSIFWI